MRRWLTRLPAILGSAAIGLLLLVLPRTNPIELFLLDARFVIAAAVATPGELSGDIAIIRMDERSEAALGVPYGSRWRKFHPQLLSVLDGAGTSLVVFDSEFMGEEPDLDPGFAEALKASGRVIAGVSRGGATPPRGGRSAGHRLAVDPRVRRGAAGGDHRFARRGNGVPRGLRRAPLQSSRAEAGPVLDRLPPSSPVFPRVLLHRRAARVGGRIADADRTPLSLFKEESCSWAATFRRRPVLPAVSPREAAAGRHRPRLRGADAAVPAPRSGLCPPGSRLPRSSCSPWRCPFSSA